MRCNSVASSFTGSLRKALRAKAAAGELGFKSSGGFLPWPEEANVATHAGLTETCSRPSRSAKGALRSRMRILVDQHFRIGNNVRVQ
jgi:hypothetical protein